VERGGGQRGSVRHRRPGDNERGQGDDRRRVRLATPRRLDIPGVSISFFQLFISRSRRGRDTRPGPSLPIPVLSFPSVIRSSRAVAQISPTLMTFYLIYLVICSNSRCKLKGGLFERSS
jgi:hypothetical protein